MTLRNLFATAALAGLLASLPVPSAGSAAAEEPAELRGELRVTAGQVVATVVVPPTSAAEYVSRVFVYDVYGTCWNRRGTALTKHETRIGGGRVPGSSGDYQLRLPPSGETTFRFTTPVASFLEPVFGVPLRTVACPAGTTSGPSRVHLRNLEVYASSFGGRTETAQEVQHLLAAPASVLPAAKHRR